MAYINFDPQDYFNTVPYAGNSTTTNAITGVGFQPDWVWLKGRTIAESHRLYDVVRGASNHISTNGTVAQASNFPLTSFDSDGFTIGSADGSVNGAYNYASWNWKANGSGVSNTDGSITSTVSANTTSGFSVVQYTGTGATPITIGHGLGSVPKMIIGKQTSGSANGWGIYHSSIGATAAIAFDTATPTTATGFFNDTTPTSSFFTLGDSGRLNQSGQTYIAYCFAEKKGFSKFGSYTGNGNADGTFIYTGFKPAFVIIKNSSSIGAWYMQDNKRDVYNPIALSLNASDANADNNQGNIMDFLSNGIKIRNTGTGYNTSSGTYIYMAFAENPLVNSLGNPATAR